MVQTANPMIEVNSENFPTIQKSSSIIVNQTYSYRNNSGFYNAVNPSYAFYYWHTIRNLCYWLDGYNPFVHVPSNGIFSTRLANSLVSSIGETIFGRELLFKNVGKEKAKVEKNPTLEFVSNWAKKSDFQSACKRGLKAGVGLGTSLLKLNIDGKGDLWLDSVRLDQFTFSVDARGNLREVTSLLKGYTSNANKEESTYYLVEKRFFKFMKEITYPIGEDGKNHEQAVIKQVPYVTYLVKKYTGQQGINDQYDMNMVQTMRWDSIPLKVRESIKSDYGNIKVGEDIKLPVTFGESLGAELYLRDEGNVSTPNMPFGTPLLENLVVDLMAYDIANSYFFRDMYMGKGTVVVPKQYIQNEGSGVNNSNPFTGLDESIFTYYKSGKMDGIDRPVSVQFDLRSTQWAEIRNYIVENIAMKLQMSPRMIASFVGDGGVKTATQVYSEDGASISFVESHRAAFEKPVNKLLKVVTSYYAYADEVEIRYSKEGVSNMSEQIKQIKELKAMGLISDREALRRIYLDSDESQIEEMYKDIQKDNQERMKQMSQAAGFGGDSYT